MISNNYAHGHAVDVSLACYSRYISSLYMSSLTFLINVGLDELVVERQHLPLMFQILGVSADEPQAHRELSIAHNMVEISPESVSSRDRLPADLGQSKRSMSKRGNGPTMASVSSCSGNYNADPGKANLSCNQGNVRPISTGIPALPHDGGRGEAGTTQLIRFAQNVGGSRRFLVSRSGHVFVARGIPVTSLVSMSISSFIQKLLS